MNRGDHRILVGLSIAVIAVSTFGWRLPPSPWLHSFLFVTDTLVGLALLTFALAQHSEDLDE